MRQTFTEPKAAKRTVFIRCVVTYSGMMVCLLGLSFLWLVIDFHLQRVCIRVCFCFYGGPSEGLPQVVYRACCISLALVRFVSEGLNRNKEKNLSKNMRMTAG